MAFEQADVNYATEYAREMVEAYPYLSYFADILGNANSRRYRPVSAKSIVLQGITVSGARNVNRNSIDGQFSRNWNNDIDTLTISVDREWDTILDPMDIEQSGQVATVANVTKVFNEQQKIPEMDAYIASKLNGFATTEHKDTTTLSTENILTKWDDYCALMSEARVPLAGRVCYMTPTTYKLLKQAAGITRFIDVRNEGGLNRNIGSLDGVRIIEVPSDLMMSVCTLEATDGYTTSGKQINMIFVNMDAVLAPVIYETAMVSAPSAVTRGKWVYYERQHYDVFKLKQKEKGIIVNVAA